MLIRSTRHACFVILRNGLTLELFYGAGFAEGRSLPLDDFEPHRPELSTRAASQGVWMLREEVLFEVKVGVA